MMANAPHADEQPQPPKHSPKRRGWFKVGAVLLLLGGAGSAGAYHFLNGNAERPPAPVEYKEPDIGQAKAEVKEAQTKVMDDRQALEAAQKTLEKIQTEWEAAQKAREHAEAKLKSVSAQELAAAQQSLEKAEQRLAWLTKELNAAKAQVKTAGDRLKSDKEKKEDAEEKQQRIQEQLAKQESQRLGLLGTWKRSDYYGTLTLELNEDGQGLMTIDFNTATAFFVRTDKLEVDIKWKVAVDDHLIFDSIRGRPEKAFRFVTVTQKKGTHRDQVLEQLSEDSFTTHDVGEEDDVKTWTRIKADTEAKSP